jgi:hypothetical protein
VKSRKHLVLVGLTLSVLLSATAGLADTVSVTVDPAHTWVGYMNVFNPPVGSGGYLWGSPWGTADLAAVFTGDQLKLSPNTNCYNAADPYWVNPDGSGAKWMNANMYVEPAGVLGKTLEFSGQVLSNTFVAGYSSQAFIKVLDPSQGWATILQVYTPLVGGQNFTLSLAIPDTAGLVPQYGFVTDGLVANPATVEQLGCVIVGPIPEPASLALLGLAGLLIRRR